MRVSARPLGRLRQPAGPTGQYLVHSGPHRALQHHLQHLGVGRVLLGGEGQLPCLLLHVLDGHLHGCQHCLWGSGLAGAGWGLKMSCPKLAQGSLDPCWWRGRGVPRGRVRNSVWGLLQACM